MEDWMCWVEEDSKMLEVVQVNTLSEVAMSISDPETARHSNNGVHCIMTNSLLFMFD